MLSMFKTKRIHLLTFFFLSLFFFVPFATRAEGFAVCCDDNHGAYVYDRHGQIVGFLLNGCPIALDLITPIDLGADACFDVDTPYCINRRYVSSEIDPEKDRSAQRWAIGVKIRENGDVFSGFPDIAKGEIIHRMTKMEKIKIAGVLEDYYFTYCNGAFGYTECVGFFINPTFGKSGIRYSRDLTECWHSFIAAEITGNETISELEAIERARAAVEQNWQLLGEFDKDYDGPSEIQCTGVVTDGFDTAWDIQVNFKDGRIFMIRVSVQDGTILEFALKLDAHG